MCTSVLLDLMLLKTSIFLTPLVSQNHHLLFELSPLFQVSSIILPPFCTAPLSSRFGLMPSIPSPLHPPHRWARAPQHTGKTGNGRHSCITPNKRGCNFYFTALKLLVVISFPVAQVLAIVVGAAGSLKLHETTYVTNTRPGIY